MTKTEIMKEAHRIAKEELEGDYQARLALALKIAWKEAKGMKIEFEKKGYQFVAEVKGEEIFITADGISEKCTLGEHPKRGWYYLVNDSVAKELSGKDNTEVKVLHPTAERAAKEIENAKKKQREQEKQKGLVFKVEEADLGSGAWNMTTTILVQRKELLSDEQKEKVRKLENMFGQTAKFAGATKHLSAKRLDVEVGEEYTLDEIIELAKETTAWKQAEKKEEQKQKEREKEFEKATQTGEKVEIDRTTVNCNDSNKECSTDLIVEYALPNSETETERIHTY